MVNNKILSKKELKEIKKCDGHHKSIKDLLKCNSCNILFDDRTTREDRLYPKKTKQVNWLFWSIGLNVILILLVAILMQLGIASIEQLNNCLIK